MMFNLFSIKKPKQISLIYPTYKVKVVDHIWKDDYKLLIMGQRYSLYSNTRQFIDAADLLNKDITISNQNFEDTNLILVLRGYQGGVACYVSNRTDKNAEFCTLMLGNLFGGIPLHIFCKVN